MQDGIRVVLLTGSIASGKTTIATEIGEILPPARAIISIDLDQLGWAFIPDAPGDRIPQAPDGQPGSHMAKPALSRVPARSHLGSDNNCRRAWADSRGDRTIDVDGRPAITSPQLLEERLRRRDAGRLLADHLAAIPELDRMIERSNLEDFRVTNDQRSPREVAMEVLETIGWA